MKPSNQILIPDAKGIRKDEFTNFFLSIGSRRGVVNCSVHHQLNDSNNPEEAVISFFKMGDAQEAVAQGHYRIRDIDFEVKYLPPTGSFTPSKNSTIAFSIVAYSVPEEVVASQIPSLFQPFVIKPETLLWVDPDHGVRFLFFNLEDDKLIDKFFLEKREISFNDIILKTSKSPFTVPLALYYRGFLPSRTREEIRSRFVKYGKVDDLFWDPLTGSGAVIFKDLSFAQTCFDEINFEEPYDKKQRIEISDTPFSSLDVVPEQVTRPPEPIVEHLEQGC